MDGKELKALTDAWPVEARPVGLTYELDGTGNAGVWVADNDEVFVDEDDIESEGEEWKRGQKPLDDRMIEVGSPLSANHAADLFIASGLRFLGNEGLDDDFPHGPVAFWNCSHHWHLEHDSYLGEWTDDNTYGSGLLHLIDAAISAAIGKVKANG